MQKLTAKQKNNVVAGARTPAPISTYLKMFSLSSWINIGVGVASNLMNIITSTVGSQKKQPISYNIPQPKTKNG